SKGVTTLIGTASARGPAALEFRPTILPAASASGPPEFPGARCRSAWIHERPFRSIGPIAHTMPVLSAPRTPSGWPTAATNEPIRTVSGSASVAAGKLKTPGLAAAKHRCGDALADPVRPQGRLEIGGIGDASRAERDDDVADRQARRGGRATRLHLDHDDGRLLIEVEPLPHRLR